MQPDEEQRGEGDWSYYWATLDGNPPPLHSDVQIEPGYYRVRPKGKPSEPVMILVENDVYIAERAGIAVPSSKIADLFRWCCRSAITYDAFVRARDGGGWADEPPELLGHNLPKEADPYDRIRILLEGEMEAANEMLAKPIETQDDADRLGIWKTRLVALKNQAEAELKAERGPVKAEYDRITGRWSGLISNAAGAAQRLLDHVDLFMRKKDQLEIERQATARRNADALRATAKEMAAKAVEDRSFEGMKEAGAVVAAAQAADREAEYRNPQAGRTHAKVKLVTRVTAMITDYDAALAQVKDDSGIMKIVQSRANLAAKAGNPLPGTQRVETKVPV
jgi:hypothetical protein